MIYCYHLFHQFVTKDGKLDENVESPRGENWDDEQVENNTKEVEDKRQTEQPDEKGEKPQAKNENALTR